MPGASTSIGGTLLSKMLWTILVHYKGHTVPTFAVQFLCIAVSAQSLQPARLHNGRPYRVGYTMVAFALCNWLNLVGQQINAHVHCQVTAS
jgi:hypothetical protein